MTRLLAKSYDRKKFVKTPPDYALLTQHSRDVATACNALAQTVGKIALSNADINAELFEHFQKTLRANGWIQDLGKANSHFQMMVTTTPETRQLIRHETISGVLIWLDERMRRWLEPLSETLLISIWGAMGHHRKFDESSKPEQVSSLTVYVSHQDFAKILSEMSKDLGLDAPPCFERDLTIGRSNKDGCDISALESLNDLQDEFIDYEEDFGNEEKLRTLALVKGFGIAADVAASAVAARGTWETNYNLANFVSDSFSIGLTVDDFSSLINKPFGSNFDVKRDEFQNDVAASDSLLTLVQAGCGSGKSLAAYKWARKWCNKFSTEGRTNFRLFFCLPTTGTTTEHFKDYALESGIDTNLCHSRASVDLRAIAETAAQEEASEDESDSAKAAQAMLNATRDKIESLELWSTPLVVSTSDTVLGLMANSRRAVYTLPAIMCSAIVFDEIHAFDEQLFGHLLVFIKNFRRLPVLLMTASLPEDRLQAIKNVRPDLFTVSGPEEFETLKRYIINDNTTEVELWEKVDECVASGGKVLWVRNRVEWANEIFDKCRERYANVYVDVYHSRFRYKDRSKRHRRVIDSFKTENKATILVATQVAEMSLDLSADLLVTDIAPVPSLIQRMGRLNRRMQDLPKNKQEAKLALICPLPQGEKNVELPYKKEDFDKTKDWFLKLRGCGRELNQHDLSRTFTQVCDENEYDLAAAEERAVFFSGLWRTRPGMTRGEGHTVSVILERDLKACDERNKQGEPTRDWVRNHEVSILFKEAVMKWHRVGCLRVAPSDSVEYNYDELTEEGTGARWKKN